MSLATTSRRQAVDGEGLEPPRPEGNWFTASDATDYVLSILDDRVLYGAHGRIPWVGFEPTTYRSLVGILYQLGHQGLCVREDAIRMTRSRSASGGSRTHNVPILSRHPLPLGYRGL